jgi:hypothetical protein
LRKAAEHAGIGAVLSLALLDAGNGEAGFRIRGFGAGLFEDAEMVWMLGGPIASVEQLAPRPVLMREIARQSGARLATDPAQVTLTLYLSLSPPG